MSFEGLKSKIESNDYCAFNDIDLDELLLLNLDESRQITMILYVKCKDFIDTINDLQDSNDEMYQTYNYEQKYEMKSDNETKTSIVSDDNEYNELIKQNNELKNTCQVLKTQNQRLIDKLKETQNNNNNNNEINPEIINKFNDIKIMAQAVLEQNIVYEKRDCVHKVKIELLENDVSELNDEIEILKHRIDVLNKERNDIELMSMKKDDIINKMKLKYSNDVDVTNQINVKYKENINELIDETMKLKQMYKDIKSRNTVYKRELNDLKNANIKLARDNRQIINDKNISINKYNELCMDMENTQNDLYRIKNDNNTLRMYLNKSNNNSNNNNNNDFEFI